MTEGNAARKKADAREAKIRKDLVKQFKPRLTVGSLSELYSKHMREK